LRHRFTYLLLAALACAGTQPLAGQRATATARVPQPPASVRLYVLDGGTLESDPERYRLKKEDVATTQLSIVSFLIVHPKGTLMWDTGAIADDSWTPNGRAVQRRLVLSNSQERLVTLRNSLTAQLAAIGYSPATITYLALSHYHWDHTANANLFARATWLARPIEREAMLPQRPPDVPQPSTFAELRNSKTIPITTDDHDVFGDGTVVLKLAKGHTPGHQVLYVKLAKTGGVVLSGDLYHYPEERTLNRLPVAEFNVDQTRASREAIEAFLKQTGASLWIQHDFTGMAKVKKSPAYYD
jgi:glyoxylase-like metal-dependent hydrolase (beta-lactamase superfamily II)